jgi:hypothetical protein
LPPQREDVAKYVGIALSKGPRVMLKIGWRYLMVKKKAQRAETLFKQRLLASGMEADQVDRLTDQYASTVSIRQFLQTMGVPRTAFKCNGHK